MEDLLTFLTSGKYLPAIGAALVLAVGLARAGLAKKWAWFASQTGGYVLAWGSTTVLYVGTSLEQGQLTWAVAWHALIAGFVASGIYTHWQDLVTAAKKVPPPGPLPTAILLSIVIGLSFGFAGGCGATPPKPIQDAVDCTKAAGPQLIGEEEQCTLMVPDWAKVESCATAAASRAGWDVGTCIVADLVQQYLTSKGAATAAPENTKAAHDLLEKVRAEHAGGKSIKTAHGAL